MADPLSIAGSIAGLVSLAAQTFTVVDDYIKAVKDAKPALETMAFELRSLSGMLQDLRLLARSLGAPESHRIFLQQSQLTGLTSTLQHIDKLLSKPLEEIRSGGVKATLRSLKWPFAKGETEQLTKRLQEHKASISLAISADTLNKLLESLQIQTAMQTTITDTRDVIQKIQDMHARVQIDDKNRIIREFFLKVNPQARLQRSLTLRENGTGEWLLTDPAVMQWLTIPGSKLWLRGHAGSGKTVLCGALIDRALADCSDDHAVAFFFCDYGDVQTQSLTNILSTLVLQLALQNQEAFDLLQNYHEELHPKSGLPRPADPVRLANLVGAMSGHFASTILVVDALDECADSTRDVVRGLLSAAKAAPNIRSAFFSRVEQEIEAELSPSCQSVDISAQTSDLEVYINSQMTLSRTLSALDPAEARSMRLKLLAKADGMFRWVACQLDWLEGLGPSGREEAMEHLPPTLDKSYDRIIDRNLATRGKGVVHEIVRNTLHWICYDPSGLSIKHIREALGVILSNGSGKGSSGPVDESEIVGYCSSLVRRSLDGKKLELAHFTVREYLNGIDPSTPRGVFRYSQAEACRTLTLASLRFVMLPEFNVRPRLNNAGCDAVEQRATERPFYWYASRFWARNTEAHSHPSISPLLCDLFARNHKMAFQNWLIQLIYATPIYFFNNPDDDANEVWGTSIISYVVSQDIQPLHVAAALSSHHLCDWLIHQGADINVKTGRGLSAWHFALGGPDLFAFLTLNWDGSQIRQFMCHRKPWTQIGPLDETLDILEKHQIHMSPIPDGSIGLLALTASFETNDPRLFLRLLETDPEQHLDSVTIGALLFASAGVDMPGTLHHSIIQGILDLKFHPRKSTTITQAVEAVQGGLRSGDSWDAYDHGGVEFLPDEIPDEDLGDYLSDTAIQGRVREMSRLLQDPRLHIGEPNAARMLIDAAMEAAEYNCPGVLELLLDAGISRPDRNNEGDTIWHVAARADSTGVLEVLLRREAHLEALTAQNRSLRTPIAEAVYFGSERAAEMLVEICDHNSAALHSEPPLLHLAVGAGSEAIYRAVLDKFPLVPTTSSNGSTPLHWVRNVGSDEFIDRLASQYDLKQQDAAGKTAFEKYLETSLSRLREITDPGSRLRALLPADQKAPGSGQHAWRVFCDLLQAKASSGFGLQAGGPFFGELVAGRLSMLVIGLHQARITTTYEEQENQPALIPLYDSLATLNFDSGTEHWEAAFFGAATDVLGASASTLSHASAVKLLKRAVKGNYPPLIRAMVQRGTPITVKIDGESVLDASCRYGPLDTFIDLFRTVDISVINDQSEGGPHFMWSLIRTQPTNTRRKYATIALGKLKFALSNGASPDARSPQIGFGGVPIVVKAAAIGRYDIVDLLRQANADCTATSTDNNMDLVKQCIWQGNIDLLRSLLEGIGQYDWTTNARVMTPEQPGTKRAPISCTALHLATMNADFPMMEYLLDEHSVHVDITAARGWTSLHLASFLGHEESVKFLLDRQADINKTTPSGRYAIDIAMSAGHEDVVVLLLEQDPSQSSERLAETEDGRKDQSGLGHERADSKGKSVEKSPRGNGSMSRRKDANETGIPGSSNKVKKHVRFPEHEEDSDESCLPAGADDDFGVPESRGTDKTASRTHPDEATEDADADTSNHPRASMEDEVGNRPRARETSSIPRSLEKSIRKGDFGSFVAVLSQGCPVDVQMPSCDGCDALRYAVHKGEEDMVTYLLNSSAIPTPQSCQKHEGDSVLHIAAARPQLSEECLTLLLDKALEGGYWPVCDLYDHHPLTLAIHHGNMPMLTAILKHVDEHVWQYSSILQSWSSLPSPASEADVKAFFVNDAFINAANGAYPLHIAASAANAAAIDALLKAGARVDSINDGGQTPLITAVICGSGSCELVERLLDEGADVNHQDDARWSALAYAAINDYLEVATLLAERGASLQVTTNTGASLLHVAAHNDSLSCFAFLHQNGCCALDQVALGGCSILERLPPQIMSYLFEGSEGRGEPVPPRLFEFPSNLLVTALMAGSYELVCLVVRHLPEAQRARLLSEKGLSHTTPLCAAVSRDSLRCVELLAESGAGLEREGSPAGTPLMLACSLDMLEGVQYLMGRGARFEYVADGEAEEGGKGVRRSVLAAARTSPRTLSWLLSGRLEDDPPLLDAEYNAALSRFIEESEGANALAEGESALAEGA